MIWLKMPGRQNGLKSWHIELIGMAKIVIGEENEAGRV